MAKSFDPLDSGIDLDGRGLGAAISRRLQHASSKSSREEITCSGAAKRTAEE